MRITQVSYKRKISDHNYNNQEVAAVAEVSEQDSAHDVFETLKVFVDVKLGALALPEKCEIDWLCRVKEKLEYLENHADVPFDMKFTEQDYAKALDILRRIRGLKSAMDAYREGAWPDYEYIDPERYEELLTAYFEGV